MCIFYIKGYGHLHEFRTLDADDNVRSMVMDLQETESLARIVGGSDHIALDARYHLTCLEIQNQHRSLMRQNQDPSVNNDRH